MRTLNYLALSFTAALIACGGGSDGGENPPSGSTDDPTNEDFVGTAYNPPRAEPFPATMIYDGISYDYTHPGFELESNRDDYFAHLEAGGGVVGFWDSSVALVPPEDNSSFSGRYENAIKISVSGVDYERGQTVNQSCYFYNGQIPTVLLEVWLPNQYEVGAVLTLDDFIYASAFVHDAVGYYSEDRCTYPTADPDGQYNDYTWGSQFGAHDIRLNPGNHPRQNDSSDYLEFQSLEIVLTDVHHNGTPASEGSEYRFDDAVTGEFSFTFLDINGNTRSVSAEFESGFPVVVSNEEYITQANGYFFRTDNGGDTIVKLDGNRSYSCSWRDCPDGITCGVKVNAEWYGPENIFVFHAPNSDGGTTSIEYSLSGTGVRWALENQTHLGEYEKAASYEAATENDLGGYCSNIE